MRTNETGLAILRDAGIGERDGTVLGWVRCWLMLAVGVVQLVGGWLVG